MTLYKLIGIVVILLGSTRYAAWEH